MCDPLNKERWGLNLFWQARRCHVGNQGGRTYLGNSSSQKIILVALFIACLLEEVCGVAAVLILSI